MSKKKKKKKISQMEDNSPKGTGGSPMVVGNTGQLALSPAHPHPSRVTCLLTSQCLGFFCCKTGMMPGIADRLVMRMKCVTTCNTEQCLARNNCFVLVVVVKSLSRVRLFVTPWTVACQALLPMGFSRQKYWSGLPFPSTGSA